MKVAIKTQNDFKAWLAMHTPAQRAVDGLQRKLSDLPRVECPLHHSFVPGFYVRQIFVRRGTLCITKIHKTEHPFVITRGRVSIWSEAEGVRRVRAPFTGITQPGTRRVVYVHEDCLWTTFHATDKKVVEEIERDVIFVPGSDPSDEVQNVIRDVFLAQLKEGT